MSFIWSSSRSHNLLQLWHTNENLKLHFLRSNVQLLEWDHTHACSFPRALCVARTHTHTHTHITWRIELVTRARFDFIPSLPSRLSLGPSHKQSPSSKSRYEISFAGCWQVPHVCSPRPASPATCMSLSICVCV